MTFVGRVSYLDCIKKLTSGKIDLLIEWTSKLINSMKSEWRIECKIFVRSVASQNREKYTLCVTVKVPHICYIFGHLALT